MTAGQDPRLRLVVSLTRQSLAVEAGGTSLAWFPVSTSRYGPGERNGSLCTPRGLHVVRARIGAGQPECAVFRGRRPTGEVWTEALARRHPGRDWILTRILWLGGCEPGRNRLGDVDTMARYIYIHGTPPTEALGVPGSHGCIRMGNADVMRLFELVPAGTPVLIGD
jgi:lipoprotein-anchoring transpeptidase ErfK/SrfK